MADNAKFKVLLLETFASLITAAFGLVAALAWNDTIKWAVAQVFGTESEGLGLFIYALIVTILAVIMTLLISRCLNKAKAAIEEGKE